MARTYHTAGSVDRAPHRYLPGGLLARNDNRAGGGYCPVCHARTWLAPGASEYCRGGIIQHHWRCETCSHQWLTVVHVST